MTERYIKCDECDFIKGYSPGERFRFKRPVYELGGGAVAPVEVRVSWCYECAKFTYVEDLPSQEDITAYLRTYAQTGIDGKTVFHDDMEFAGEVLNSETQWRSFATERSKTEPRCTECGSVTVENKTRFDYFSKGKIDAFPHPGCGGQLSLVEEKTDMHFSWKRAGMDERLPRAIFSRDGLLKKIEELPENPQENQQERASQIDDEYMGELDRSANSEAPFTFKSKLLENPFYLLGASALDSRDLIISHAAAPGSPLGAEQRETLVRTLTLSGRSRLAAEVAWMSGMSFEDASLLVQYLHRENDWYAKTTVSSDIPSSWLGGSNLLAATLETFTANEKLDDVGYTLFRLAYEANKIKSDEVMAEINEDREAAGYLLIESVDDVEREINLQKLYYAHVVESVIDRIPQNDIDAVMAAAGGWCAGDRYPLRDTIFRKYESKANSMLEPSAKSIFKGLGLLTDGRALTPEAEDHGVGAALIKELSQWNALAKPLRMNLRAYGLEHELSHTLALEVRRLAELFASHNRPELAWQLIGILKTLFEDMPEFVKDLERGGYGIRAANQPPDNSRKIDELRVPRRSFGPAETASRTGSPATSVLWEFNTNTFFKKNCASC